MSWTDRANDIAARWEHGHAELTSGCALCQAEFAEVVQMTHGPQEEIKPVTSAPRSAPNVIALAALWLVALITVVLTPYVFTHRPWWTCVLWALVLGSNVSFAAAMTWIRVLLKRAEETGR